MTTDEGININEVAERLVGLAVGGFVISAHSPGFPYFHHEIYKLVRLLQTLPRGQGMRLLEAISATAEPLMLAARRARLEAFQKLKQGDPDAQV